MNNLRYEEADAVEEIYRAPKYEDYKELKEVRYWKKLDRGPLVDVGTLTHLSILSTNATTDPGTVMVIT
jgi:hypothetical protein